MARQPKITSITDDAAHRHLTAADNWESLGCTLISGFYLQKLTKGCAWRYRYTDSAGKRRVATIGKYPGLIPHEAALRAREWQEHGIDPLRAKERRKQAEVAEDVLREQRTVRKYLEGKYRRIMDTWPENSRQQAERRFYNHFPTLLDRPMDEITHADMERWQAEAEAKGLAHNTIKRIYSGLKTLLRQAVKHRVIEADPLAGFELSPPTIKEQERIRQAEEEAKQADRRMLSDDEIDGLHYGLDAYADELKRQRRNSRAHGKPDLPDLDAVAYPHWFIPMAHLGFHTGLRPGDLLSVTWTELNVRFARLVKIPSKTSHKAARKGVVPAEIDMPLNQTIVAIMRLWWEQQGKPKTGLVFPSPVTGGQLDKKAYLKPWTRVKKLGRLPADLDFYALRHNFISALVAQGLPMLTIAKLAGHKSTAMIEQHYGHLCPQQASEAVDVLARHARGSEEKKRAKV